MHNLFSSYYSYTIIRSLNQSVFEGSIDESSRGFRQTQLGNASQNNKERSRRSKCHRCGVSPRILQCSNQAPKFSIFSKWRLEVSHTQKICQDPLFLGFMGFDLTNLLPLIAAIYLNHLPFREVKYLHNLFVGDTLFPYVVMIRTNLFLY